MFRHTDRVRYAPATRCDPTNSAPGQRLPPGKRKQRQRLLTGAGELIASRLVDGPPPGEGGDECLVTVATTATALVSGS
jgi:hypothetical protein